MRIRFWRRAANDRHAREAWEAGLSWFRLRYLDSRGLRRALRLLSSARPCGRVALYYLPDDNVSRLYIGVPAAQVAVLQRMSADLQFMIQRSGAWQPLPIMPLTAAERLPWERPFYAHLVEGRLFLARDADTQGEGAYLPPAPRGTAAPAVGRFPQPAPAGLSLEASWNGQRAPAELRRSDGRTGWPLGRSCDGVSLVAGPVVNVYGSDNSPAGWLAHLVEYLLREESSGLIVLDGKGDLVPTLKRKPAVTRLLGPQLLYVNVDGETVSGGFNPLAATPGEGEGETVQRWRQWFGGMGVHREGLQLLARAMAGGVADIATLARWLQRPQQQPFAAGVAALQTALRRMQRDPVVREWFSWPTNIFGSLPQGNLLLSCRDGGWPRQQLLRAALLAALSLREARLIIHGYPWSAEGFGDVLPETAAQILLSNGPRLQESAVVLTRSAAPAAAKLAAQFLSGDALREEQMQLLRTGEALVVQGKEAIYARWPQKGSGDDPSMPYVL